MPSMPDIKLTRTDQTFEFTRRIDILKEFLQEAIIILRTVDREKYSSEMKHQIEERASICMKGV